MTARETSSSSRQLKQSASSALASFRPSTYRKRYASGLHSLRPCCDRLFEQPAGNAWLSPPSYVRARSVILIFQK